MKKSCDDYMNDFLMLDKDQHIPLKLSMHLLTCKDCRKLVRSLTKAEKISSQPVKLSTPVNSEQITNIVKQIDPSYNPKEKMSFASWIASGVILLFSMIFTNVITRGISSSVLSLVIIMSFAFFFIFYCVAFIYSNIDFFVKKIGPNLAS